MNILHNLPDYKHRSSKQLGDLCKKAKETNNSPVKRWILVKVKCNKNVSKKEALIYS